MKNSIHHILTQLKPASPVTVEITDHVGKRISARSIFIGYLPNQFLFLQAPDARKLDGIDSLLQPQTVCTVRALCEEGKGAVMAFLTTIEKVIDSPTKMLACSLPREVASQSLRDKVRIPTLIEGSLSCEKHTSEVKILDVSAEGCRVLIEKDHPFTLKVRDCIAVRLGELKNEDCFSLTGVVCSIKKQAEFEFLGIKFDVDTSSDIELLIKKLIFNQ
ncbi:hypothetical protein PULV_a3080 [Pseudoalteromonas ulvae UL12]|uniref:Flagellar brake protein n=1 Tax=Pseudoalteromonas ulvae TaxID=107327 RepID=A0A244CVG5_PSEDV|nr:PilZ domain-containing protein [Pseudoalteromonas ulvae]MBE0362445.1 hypothetical protein [Pseudoalteromonas ulvae UL12]OUL59571.1 hypothetical protein B1199_04835 [Pseudoalteromonas ulvae]